MSAPHPQAGLPDPEDVFDHLRREDGEHVGYIEMSADGRFIPYDRLWVRRGEAMELDEAEAVLDAIGLRLLVEDWLLEEDDLQTGEASWTRVRIREIHWDRVIVARAVEDLWPPASPSPWTSSAPSNCPSRRRACAQRVRAADRSLHPPRRCCRHSVT